MHQVQGFSDQTCTEFDFEGYRMAVPSGHPLIAYSGPGSGHYQPHREIGLVQIVQTIHRLKRQGTLIDIGANIGDSLAIMARHSSLPVLCIEASDYFIQYLETNVHRHFADRATVQHCFVTSQPGRGAQGLLHWGGTAKPIDAPCEESAAAVPVQEIIQSAGQVALFKIDTDGYDLEIIEGIFAGEPGYLPGSNPFPIYFEFELAKPNEAANREYAEFSLTFFRRMARRGYRRALLWDDPGRFYGVINIDDIRSIVNVINYMAHFRHRPVWGFDFCLVHDDDREFLLSLSDAVSAQAMLTVVP